MFTDQWNDLSLIKRLLTTVMNNETNECVSRLNLFPLSALASPSNKFKILVTNKVHNFQKLLQLIKSSDLSSVSLSEVPNIEWETEVPICSYIPRKCAALSTHYGLCHCFRLLDKSAKSADKKGSMRKRSPS